MRWTMIVTQMFSLQALRGSSILTGWRTFTVQIKNWDIDLVQQGAK
jgi:hypothetical protein